jgi:hypothetical protein
MGMRIDESRHNGFALQIDTLRTRSSVLQSVTIRPYRNEFSVSDCGGLGDGEIVVYGENLAVIDNHIRLVGGDCATGNRCT